MFLQVQFPLFDGRPLLPEPGLWRYPDWRDPGAAPGYIRQFGKVVARRAQGVEGVPAEAFFCQLRNRLRAGSDWGDPYPVTTRGMAALSTERANSNDRARFVVRRLFFDGLFSGKLDLGFFLPEHLALDHGTDGDGSAAPESSAASFAGVVACVRHLLQRTVRLGGQSTTIAQLHKLIPGDYARSTSLARVPSPLVSLHRPALYVEFVRASGVRWGEVPGWVRAELGFADVYYRPLALGGTDVPLFIARIDAGQIKNRGRHLRISTLRYTSEIGNVQRLLLAASDGTLVLADNAANRPFIHAHLKRTLKFLAGNYDAPHIAEARTLIHDTIQHESLEASINQLAELDSYWEAAKQRAMMEVVMGDKITATSGGVAVGREALVTGGIATHATVSETRFDMPALAVELEKLSAEVARRAKGPLDQADSAIIKAAADEAKAGKEDSVLGLLKKVGTGAFEIAKDIGAKLAVAYAEAKLGLG